MSFLIAVHVNEGIVLASDRRTTYTNTQTKDKQVIKRIGIHVTNSTDKTFICPNGAGISTCGDGTLLGKPITGYIQDVIRTRIQSDSTVESIPEILIDYFNSLEEVPDTTFIVAGYEVLDNGIKQQAIFKVNVKTKRVEKIDTISQGATWEGETLTLTRLIQPIALKKDNSYLDLPFEEILWSYFTLQDAIDFAKYAVETTIQTMRFKNVIETVGGNVDILVITPDGTKWLQKEQLGFPN